MILLIAWQTILTGSFILKALLPGLGLFRSNFVLLVLASAEVASKVRSYCHGAEDCDRSLQRRKRSFQPQFFLWKGFVLY